MKKQNKGITLIALVITIIVLLILAGVSIATLTGENGILTQTEEAKQKTKLEEEKEKIKLAWNALKIENLGGNVTVQQLQEELNKDPENKLLISEDFKVTLTDGKKYKIENGEIKQLKAYSIEVNDHNGFVIQDRSNPTEIDKGESVTLIFNSNNTFFTGINVDGAEYDILKLEDNQIVVKIKNPTSDVIIYISIYDCCFVAGTQVLMADGGTKNIEDVVEGDLVISYNEEKKEYQIDEVVNCIINPNTTQLARLNLIDGTKVEMNSYHPVYTEEGWKSLTEHEGLPLLTEEDKILSSNGEFIEINTIDLWNEKQPIKTYNLTIKSNHNYFVGNTPILVHNASCPI